MDRVVFISETVNAMATTMLVSIVKKPENLISVITRVVLLSNMRYNWKLTANQAVIAPMIR